MALFLHLLLEGCELGERRIRIDRLFLARRLGLEAAAASCGLLSRSLRSATILAISPVVMTLAALGLLPPSRPRLRSGPAAVALAVVIATRLRGGHRRRERCSPPRGELRPDAARACWRHGDRHGAARLALVVVAAAGAPQKNRLGFNRLCGFAQPVSAAAASASVTASRLPEPSFASRSGCLFRQPARNAWASCSLRRIRIVVVGRLGRRFAAAVESAGAAALPACADRNATASSAFTLSAR